MTRLTKEQAEVIISIGIWKYVLSNGFWSTVIAAPLFLIIEYIRKGGPISSEALLLAFIALPVGLLGGYLIQWVLLKRKVEK